MNGKRNISSERKSKRILEKTERETQKQKENYKRQQENYGKQKEKKEKWHTFTTMENSQSMRSGTGRKRHRRCGSCRSCLRSAEVLDSVIRNPATREQIITGQLRRVESFIESKPRRELIRVLESIQK